MMIMLWGGIAIGIMVSLIVLLILISLVDVDKKYYKKYLKTLSKDDLQLEYKKNVKEYNLTGSIEALKRLSYFKKV